MWFLPQTIDLLLHISVDSSCIYAAPSLAALSLISRAIEKMIRSRELPPVDSTQSELSLIDSELNLWVEVPYFFLQAEPTR